MQINVHINELGRGVCSQRSATVIAILPLPQEQSSRLFERHTAQYVYLALCVCLSVCLSVCLFICLFCCLLARDAATYKGPLLSDTVSVAVVCLTATRFVPYRERPRYHCEPRRLPVCMSVYLSI